MINSVSEINCSLSVLCSKAAIMEKKHRDLLTSNRVYLVEQLDMKELLDHMVQTGLLSDSDKEILEVIQISLLLIFYGVSLKCFNTVVWMMVKTSGHNSIPGSL